MNYIEKINELLQPKPHLDFKVLDLFAGCGGLSLGFESVGFKTVGYEMDLKAAETYKANLNGECFAKKITSATRYDEYFDAVIGGPPCQPFSVGGHQKGIDDGRNGFPSFINAVKQIKPKIWLFENVRGILYGNKWYFDEVIETLKNEGYLIDYQLLNAVNYGVPQNRERVFCVGHKGGFTFPKADPAKVTAGEAIGELVETTQDEGKILNASMDRYVANYEKASSCANPRDLYLHRPARTLTCRNLAGATGDMHRVKLKDGRRRRISTKEAARLQSFPDFFEFMGTETQQYKQIGNAVPPLLAWHIANSVKNYLEGAFFLTETEIIQKTKSKQTEFQTTLF